MIHYKKLPGSPVRLNFRIVCIVWKSVWFYSVDSLLDIEKIVSIV